MKVLYTRNYKTLLKEILNDTNKWKCISTSWIERLNILKVPILSKAIYRSNKISMKRPTPTLYKNANIHPKIGMESQETPNSQNNFEKEEQSWKTHTSWSQNILQNYSNQKCGTIINTNQYQCNGTESPETNSPIRGQMIFDKSAKNLDFPGGTVVENLSASAGDTGPGRSHMLWGN